MMMLKFIIALLFLSVSAVNVKCKGTVTDPQTLRSYEFDLSSLHHDESVYIDPLWYRTDKNVIYYVNFCGQTASACETDDTSVCLRIPAGSEYNYTSGGSTSTQTLSRAEDPSVSIDSSVTVTYSKGEKCGSGYRKTKIYVNCKENANPGFFYDISEGGECESTLYMWSAAGCGKELPGPLPSSSSSSSGNDECSATIKDTKNRRAYHFDLSPLHHDESVPVDTFWFRTAKNIIYYVNFCGQTASPCRNDTSVCLRYPNYDYISGGSTSTQTITEAEQPNVTIDSGVTVTYSNGEKCGSGYRTTKIYVSCQESADPGFFYDADVSDEFETILYMWSIAGCGKEVPYYG